MAIRQALSGAGWSESAIEAAFSPVPISLPKDSTELPRHEKPRSKLGKRVVIAVTMLLILSAALGILLPLFSPQRIVLGAINNLLRTDVSQFELSAELSSQPKLGTNEHAILSNATFLVNASIDKDKPAKGRLRIEGKNLGVGEANSAVSTAMLELLWVSEALFLKLEFAGTDTTGFGLDEFNGKWFSLNMQQTAEDFSLEQQYNTQITQSEIEGIIEAYRLHPFLIIGDRLGKQSIEGEQTQGFVIKYDLEKLAGWLSEVERITKQPNPRTVTEIRSSLPEEVEIGITKLWVAKKTKLPKRIEYEKAATVDDYGIRSSVTLNSLGKPITIDIPSDAQSLEEYIQQWTGSVNEVTDEQVTAAQSWLLATDVHNRPSLY